MRKKRLVENFDLTYRQLGSTTLLYQYDKLYIYLALLQKPIFLGYKGKKNFIPCSKKKNSLEVIDLKANDFKRLLKMEEELGIEFIEEIAKPVYEMLITYDGADITDMIEAFKDLKFNSIEDGKDLINKRSVQAYIQLLIEEIEVEYDGNLAGVVKLGARE